MKSKVHHQEHTICRKKWRIFTKEVDKRRKSQRELGDTIFVIIMKEIFRKIFEKKLREIKKNDVFFTRKSKK